MNRLLRPEEIATMLGVKKSTVYQWTHNGYIPHIKLGKVVRFDESKILDWLEKKSQKGRLTQKINSEALLNPDG